MHPIAELLNGHHTGRVLDVGTRHGDFIRTVITQAPGVTGAIGIDIGIPSLITASANRDGADVRYIAASADDMPFAPGTFDTVVMANALHHLPDPDRGFAEMLRVLRHGGMLLIAEAVRDNPSAPQASLIALHDLGGDIARLAGVSHRGFYEEAEVRAIIGALPLDDVRTVMGEPGPVETDPDVIASRADGFFSHLADIAGTPGHERYRNAVVTARMRAVRTGIQRPARLFLAGKKRAAA